MRTPYLSCLSFSLSVFLSLSVSCSLLFFATSSSAAEAFQSDSSVPLPSELDPAEETPADAVEAANIEAANTAEKAKKAEAAKSAENEAIERKREIQEAVQKALREEAEKNAKKPAGVVKKVKNRTAASIQAGIWAGGGHIAGLILTIPATIGTAIAAYALVIGLAVTTDFGIFLAGPVLLAIPTVLFGVPLLGNALGAWIGSGELDGFRPLVPIALSILFHYAGLGLGLGLGFGALAGVIGTGGGTNDPTGIVLLFGATVLAIPAAVAGSSLGASLGYFLIAQDEE